MIPNKIWIYHNSPEIKMGDLAVKAGIHPLIAKIFQNRGIGDIDYIKKYLYPSLDELHDPFLLKDMDKAVDRIINAVNGGESIVIYGDYDVDGITATSILYHFLTRLKAKVEYYIPDRMDEGYGLSMSGMDRILEANASLIITVDCGITAVEEVKYIKSKNVDVIITDHHRCKEELPDALAVVNPTRPDCEYPFKGLAGVGVAYKLLDALCIKMGLGDLCREYLDLVAIGTVADIVPLVDENRIIAKFGIPVIENSGNLGLRVLMESCGLDNKPVTSYTIGFMLAPRINAAGRVGDARRAVELFNTRDREKALDLALELNDENRYRQDMEGDIFQQALSFIDSNIDLDREKVIVVAGEGWHAGVIGIVASRITERYYRPCILITNEEGMGKGSGRSIQGFNIFDALEHCEDLLEKYGGHELAAGLSLKIENVPEFRKRINAYADAVLTEYELTPKLKIDAVIGREDVNVETVEAIEALAPFGPGNPAPLFLYNNLKASDIRTVGEGKKHLKLKLWEDEFHIDAIGFNMGEAAGSFKCGDALDVVCTMEINTWNLVERVQLNIKDLRHEMYSTVENMYFYSLDQCLDTSSLCGRSGDVDLQAEWNDTISSREDLFKVLSEPKALGGKTALLVNSLAHVKTVVERLEGSGEDFKRICSIGYGDFSCKNSTPVNIIVNPDPRKIPFDRIDRVILYGDWVSENYLSCILKKAGCSKIFFYGESGRIRFKKDEIIPERSDLAAIYRYLKANYKNEIRVENLFALAGRIGDSYRIRMNYFKLKKGLGILEEVGIIKGEPFGRQGMTLKILNNGKAKVSLDSSRLFRGLQALKAQIKDK
ncbi:MAG: single-stranded-DNA-specific exonuclease RecJ [Clostridiales bacterium]|jgi:single-stranded-DNA-specific exonuclease|nr:single-stranded-DNA-specific exonuclease RecJ [Eubacteriales bacterium]MDH7565514.1 single-stranded-DNA-specific exonuclease RecJ [Clostridiales bacterium]